jgi:MAX-like protein X
MAEANFDESIYGGSEGIYRMMEEVARGLSMQQQQQQAQQYAQQQSPTNNQHFSFSRASSLGSVNAISCSSASSTHNTDDEDSDGQIQQALTYKDRRREAHTHAEQKRRDAIKKGYDELQAVVPHLLQTESIGGPQKLSKATILGKTIDYVSFLSKEKKKQDEDLDSLRKEVMALKIMKTNLEELVRAHQSNPQQGQNQVSDDVKFSVFQQIMDQLFQSFNASISVGSFTELSRSVFSWLEEYCKPQTLRELTLHILRRSNALLTRP